MENDSIVGVTGFKNYIGQNSIVKQLSGKLERDIDPGINDKELIELWKTLRYYDQYTATHSLEVAALSYMIGEYLKERELDHLYFGGLMHDIGKLTFLDNPILIDGSPHLSEQEKQLILKHPQVGHDLVQQFTSSKIVLDMVLNHHENIDGSGYPNQKNADQLSTYARIIRIADTLSALTNYREYRKKKQYTVTEAIHILEKEKHCFDHHVVDVIKQIYGSQALIYD